MKNNTWVNILLIGAIIMLIAQIAKLPLLFALAFPVVIVSWMTLGAIRSNKIGKGLKISLILLSIIWIVGFGVLNLMDHSKFTGTILGFTPGTAIMIYIIWLLPLFAGTLVYGIRFNKDYLNESDVKKFESKTGETVDIK
jgi:hypothetical protein